MKPGRWKALVTFGLIVSMFAAPVPGTAASAPYGSSGAKLLGGLETLLATLPSDESARVIVRVRGGPTDARLTELGRSVGRLGRTLKIPLIDGFAATLARGQIAALARHPRVISVEEDLPVQASNDSAQSSFGVTQARHDAGVDGDGDGSRSTYSAQDLVAAVIDTGIDAGHLDLDGGKVIAFRDYVNGRTTPYDDHGHGTHVAATIAGDGDARADHAYQGVAPAAALVGVKVLSATGSGFMSDVAAGIDWVVANQETYGIEVINLSLGTSGCSNGLDSASLAVNRASEAGIVVVVAAGNSGPGTCTIGSPGAAAGALTVGAMADTAVGGFMQASWSSRGPTLDGRIKPDISAPGVEITSARANTSNGYAIYSGTSMATPFTAGVALLMRDVNPALTPQQVKDAMTSTAVDWGRGGDGKSPGSSGVDIDYGHGRLDAYAAIAAGGGAISTPPPVPGHKVVEGTLSGTGAFVDHTISVANAGFPVAATLLHPALSAGSSQTLDFDLYLYDPQGVQVAAAEGVLRQESLTWAAKSTGDYRLRVRSYRGSGGYFADLSFGDEVATPTPPPDPPPAPTTVDAAPAGVVLLGGTLRAGSASGLTADDNVFYAVNSTTSGTRTTSWYGSFTGVPNDLTGLKVTYKGKQSRIASQRVAIWRWTDSRWVQIYKRNVGKTEILVADIVPPGTLANYVSGTTGVGEVRIRIRSIRSSGTFTTRGDLLRIVFVSP